jgi:hypothetical protein
MMRREIAKAELEALIARPLKDYVAQLKPTPPRKVHLRPPPLNPPTFGNIGRFAAMKVRSHVDEYFLRGHDGIVYGPATETIIEEWIQKGHITKETHMSSKQEGPWLPASQIRALKDFFRQPSSPVAPGRFNNIQIK